MTIRRDPDTPVDGQAKMLRILEMIFLMNEKHSVADLAERLAVSERTIFRYLVLLQSIGFRIGQEGNHQGRVWIHSWPEQFIKSKMVAA